MYCEKLKSTPTTSRLSRSLTCAISFCLVSPRGHSLAGFNGTKNSARKEPSGSVPSSPRPCSENTVRTGSLRQVSLPQAIYCLLAHEVVIAAVFELQPNETERIDGVGADVSEPGRTGDRDLDRNRDVTFHLLGRLPWPLRDDLDDRRRGIGIGLDVECGEGYKAQAEKGRERDQHERAPQQAEGNQTTQHSASIGPAIDSPQIGQRHCVEGNRAVRRMGDDPEGTIPGPTTA